MKMTNKKTKSLMTPSMESTQDIHQPGKGASIPYLQWNPVGQNKKSSQGTSVKRETYTIEVKNGELP